MLNSFSVQQVQQSRCAPRRQLASELRPSKPVLVGALVRVAPRKLLLAKQFGARPGKAVASDHLRSSSYGASANLARSCHSGAAAERLPYLRGSIGTQT
jgi:hypothetical protein